MDHEGALVLGAGSAKANEEYAHCGPELRGGPDGVPSWDRAQVCRSRPEQVTECCDLVLGFLGGRHAL